MNFVAQLEETLRDLGTEARKKHPGVKEASERAILRLRTLQNSYVSAVRKAAANGSEHPTTALFQSQELLHPFLLAANYPNASPKLLDISFRAMRLLMEAQAICPGDGIHMVRVWTIQANVIMSSYQKSKKSQSVGAQILSPTATASVPKSAGTVVNEKSAESGPETNSSSSSWFSFIGSTSSALLSSSGADTSQSLNVVSSSSGQAGQSYAASTKDMEKVALDILSCLLQLSELLKSESLPVELWTQSVSLCCILLHFTRTVQQAAQSTLPQVLTRFYQSTTHKKMTLQTWEDLLTLASYNENPTTSKKRDIALNGAFSQCRLPSMNASRTNNSSTTTSAPSSEFALVLMTSILKDKPSLLRHSEKLLSKTFGVTVALLEHTSTGTVTLETALRSFQWALVLIQTQQSEYVIECRELLSHAIRPILLATEACRFHDDFEDGFIFTAQHKSSSESSSGGTQAPKPLPGNPATTLSSLRSPEKKAQQLQNPTESLISTALLWNAGLALELLYLILGNSDGVAANEDHKGTEEQKQNGTASTKTCIFDYEILATMTEALSDFATIGSSCQRHILQLMDVCNGFDEDHNGESLTPLLPFDDASRKTNKIQTMLFVKAEHMLASGKIDFSTSRRILEKKVSTSGDTNIMGESLWIAFHAILLISESHWQHVDGESEELQIQSTFAPSLATFQHYLKRFPASSTVLRLSLHGYLHLTEASMASYSEESEYRKTALLTSLCKFSLPLWGKHDASCLLQEQHVQALLCLLSVVHRHCNQILGDWTNLLWTFEELSVLSIASPHLSDKSYQTALAVSAVYGRFAEFSTCLTSDSLSCFVRALEEISVPSMIKRGLISETDASVLDRILNPRDKGAVGGKGSLDESKETIGEKLVSLGVRAIYGSQLNEDEQLRDASQKERTNTCYFESYRNEFVGRLQASISSMEAEKIGKLPFVALLLADVGMANASRDSSCLISITKQLCKMAAASLPIRSTVMDIVAMLIMGDFSKDMDTRRVPASQPDVDHLFLLDDCSSAQNRSLESDGQEPHLGNQSHSDVMDCSDRFPQTELFRALCDSIKTAESASMAETGVSTLASVLEHSGHTLVGDVWTLIIEAVASLAGNPAQGANRSSSEWSSSCLVAFRCLKLIIDNFLDQMPLHTGQISSDRAALLDCCASFASSRHDVNTSLTAIGLLWTIADQDKGTGSLDLALSRLVVLSSDRRAEVRNCAVNTLFSCIVGRGQGFSLLQWKTCILEVILGVYDRASSEGTEEDAGNLLDEAQSPNKSRYKVAVHHSRNSLEKQWAATQVLVLSGLNRVLRTFFDRILNCIEVDRKSMGESDNDDSEPDSDDEDEAKEWLEESWSHILKLGLEASAQSSSRDSLPLRRAGVELLVICCQVACRTGIQVALIPASVGTNMEVVDGALRSVRTSSIAQDSPERSVSNFAELIRRRFFLKGLVSLESYASFLNEELEHRTEGMSQNMHSTQVQVLESFATCLSGLYECGKNNEFNPGEERNSIALERYFKQRDVNVVREVDLEWRFLHVVITVLRTSSGSSRFLSQAQHTCMKLLKSMIKNGSSGAILIATSISIKSFFWQKDESSQNDDGSSLLSYEVAKLVSAEIQNEDVSDVCRVIALVDILSGFCNVSDNGGDDQGQKVPDYELLVPVMKCGMHSEKLLRSSATTKPNYGKLVDQLWERACSTIDKMLSIRLIDEHNKGIARAQEVTDIVSESLSNVPIQHRDDLFDVLLEGALRVIDALNLHVSRSDESDQTQFQSEALQLFTKCYSGVLLQKPEADALVSITQKVLEVAIDHIDKGTMSVLVTESTFSVCDALKISESQRIVVANFSSLCKLMTADEPTLRRKVVDVLSLVDVRRMLEDEERRRREAEKRADDAEKQISSMSRTLKEMELKIESLQKGTSLTSFSFR